MYSVERNNCNKYYGLLDVRPRFKAPGQTSPIKRIMEKNISLAIASQRISV